MNKKKDARLTPVFQEIPRVLEALMPGTGSEDQIYISYCDFS